MSVPPLPRIFAPVDGVVLGKMDNRFPVAYVLSAAEHLADRAGHADRAASWRLIAMNVQRAWTTLSERNRTQRRWQYLHC